MIKQKRQRRGREIGSSSSQTVDYRQSVGSCPELDKPCPSRTQPWSPPYWGPFGEGVRTAANLPGSRSSQRFYNLVPLRRALAARWSTPCRRHPRPADVPCQKNRRISIEVTQAIIGPECVWLGRRVVVLMWRDDLDTASSTATDSAAPAQATSCLFNQIRSPFNTWPLDRPSRPAAPACAPRAAAAQQRRPLRSAGRQAEARGAPCSGWRRPALESMVPLTARYELLSVRRRSRYRCTVGPRGSLGLSPVMVKAMRAVVAVAIVLRDRRPCRPGADGEK